MIIGLVGEICSGKSTVAKILQQNKKYYYIEVDKVGHFILEPDKPAYNEVVEHFGKDILNEDKTINRDNLGQIVFNNNEQLTKLNTITHKYIYQEIKNTINKLRFVDVFEDQFNVIIDGALLYEIRLDSLIDEVWYIEANKEIRLNRLMERNNYTKEEALNRIKSQNISKHKNKADKIINNNLDIKELEEKIKRIIN